MLLATPVFAAPPESQALVRQMVMENDRLWTIPRELMKAPAKRAIDHLEDLRVPTLVLIGEQDAAQREQAEILAKRVPGARLIVIPGGGHLLNLTSPQVFRATVAAVSSLGARPAGCTRRCTRRTGCTRCGRRVHQVHRSTSPHPYA